MCSITLSKKEGADEACHTDYCMNIYAFDISVSAREHRIQIAGIQIRTLAKCDCVFVCDLCVGTVEDYRPGSALAIGRV